MLGRADQLKMLLAHVSAGARLTTISGTGGIGKTTLARALLEQHANAVFVPLSAADDLDDMVALVARALEVSANTDAEIRERVARRLEQGALLVLDNLEHLPGSDALIDAWTERAPRLRIVATSRARLGLPYENVIELGQLSLDDSVQLFAMRTGISDPDAREAIEQIVRLLDGVPLAIELAAGRARQLPLDALASRAHDIRWLTGESKRGLPRHRSIDDLVEWSWSLLEPPLRATMIELWAFRGGVSAQMAEAHFPGVTALREQGLVSLTDSRFRLLEIVRAFVEAHADVSAAREHHARLFVAEAERLDALLPSNRAAPWLKSELENLRAAATFPHSDPALASRAALALDAALTMCGLPRRSDLLEMALAMGATEIDRARAMARLALCRWNEGRISTALAEEAWTLAEHTNDPATQACAANALVRHLSSSGRGEESAALARRFSEPSEAIDPFLRGQIRAAALAVLPVRELVRSYPRWLEEPAERTQSERELSRFALVLAAAGEPVRALEVLPEHGPDAARMRAHVLLAANRFADAADAYGHSADLARQEGHHRAFLWAAMNAATLRGVAAGATHEIDALIDEFVALGSVADSGLIAAALAGAPHARALLVARRSSPAFERFAVELEALDALDAHDEERMERCIGVLERRVGELPPTRALDTLVVHRILRAQLAQAPRRTLTIGPEASWFRLGDGDPVNIASLEVPRRVLLALIESERDVDALFAAGWPGQRASRESMRNRVSVTLTRLRKLGLDPAIERTPTGWRLMRDIDVVRENG